MLAVWVCASTDHAPVKDEVRLLEADALRCGLNELVGDAFARGVTELETLRIAHAVRHCLHTLSASCTHQQRQKHVENCKSANTLMHASMSLRSLIANFRHNVQSFRLAQSRAFRQSGTAVWWGSTTWQWHVTHEMAGRLAMGAAAAWGRARAGQGMCVRVRGRVRPCSVHPEGSSRPGCLCEQVTMGSIAARWCC